MFLCVIEHNFPYTLSLLSLSVSSYCSSGILECFAFTSCIQAVATNAKILFGSLFFQCVLKPPCSNEAFRQFLASWSGPFVPKKPHQGTLIMWIVECACVWYPASHQYWPRSLFHHGTVQSLTLIVNCFAPLSISVPAIACNSVGQCVHIASRWSKMCIAC